MYTGKLQVIKALTSSFERQNESHHIIITAPTGTAVALVGGSTYHSILGINDESEWELDRMVLITCF